MTTALDLIVSLFPIWLVVGIFAVAKLPNKKGW